MGLERVKAGRGLQNDETPAPEGKRAYGPSGGLAGAFGGHPSGGWRPRGGTLAGRPCAGRKWATSDNIYSVYHDNAIATTLYDELACYAKELKHRES